jgi:predicted membrane channel-forming protein YqfA (hemolysin III family)
MIAAGLAILALGAILYARDWPRILGGVPYTELRHHVYEWIVFVGWCLLVAGVMT